MSIIPVPIPERLRLCEQGDPLGDRAYSFPTGWTLQNVRDYLIQAGFDRIWDSSEPPVEVELSWGVSERDYTLPQGERYRLPEGWDTKSTDSWLEEENGFTRTDNRQDHLAEAGR